MIDLQWKEELRLLPNGTTLEVVSAGPVDGPLLVLLHGFPDNLQTWKNQIPAFVAAGFRVLAPNQRGYGRSDRPSGVSSYDLDPLVEDVLALASSEGHEQFQIVGHDWGGIVGWWAAASAPHRVTRLAVLNAPHPGVFRRYVRSHPRQMMKSWYVAFFQIPRLPEALLRARNYQGLLNAVKTAGPGRLNDQRETKKLIESWSHAGSLSGMIHYYRALSFRSDQSLRRRVPMPVLLLFSGHDPALESGLAFASQTLCDHSQLILLKDAKHWLHWEQPVAVTEYLLSFLESDLCSPHSSRSRIGVDASR